jgi:hypothetical protein
VLFDFLFHFYPLVQLHFEKGRYEFGGIMNISVFTFFLELVSIQFIL